MRGMPSVPRRRGGAVSHLMRLSHPFPSMTAAGRQRIEAALGDKPCRCHQNRVFFSMPAEGGETATLVKRKIKHYVAVYLQCDTCGAGIGGALARGEHYYWQNYPEWDAERETTYHEKWEAELRQKSEEDRALRLENYRLEREQKAAEYARFCRESPDWHQLRNAVLERASFTCEACLSAPAATAHHLTYEFGPLPPAWYLRAVCRNCHNRLHASKHFEVDDWDRSSWPSSF